MIVRIRFPDRKPSRRKRSIASHHLRRIRKWSDRLYHSAAQLLNPESLDDPEKPRTGTREVVAHLSHAVEKFNSKFNHEKVLAVPPGEEIPWERIEKVGEIVERSESDILIRVNPDFVSSLSL